MALPDRVLDVARKVDGEQDFKVLKIDSVSGDQVVFVGTRKCDPVSFTHSELEANKPSPAKCVLICPNGSEVYTSPEDLEACVEAYKDAFGTVERVAEAKEALADAERDAVDPGQAVAAVVAEKQAERDAAEAEAKAAEEAGDNDDE